ncbi:MAG: metalloregulator ArsR/SmtB family transcription factor [Bacilli bacterium]
MENEKEKNIEKIKESMLSKDSFDSLSSFYYLFADPTRLTIISLLIHEELCVSDIVEVMGVSQSVVSHQLQILRKHDIVTFKRKGKSVLYSLTDNHIKDLFSTGLEHISERNEDLYYDRKKKGF